MKKLILMSLFGFVFLLNSCDENQKTDIVDSGTYQGIAEKVEPGEREIYVRTSDDKLLELYFTDETTLTKDGSSTTFDSLKEDGKVEVTVEKKGNKLVPISVKVLN